MNEPAQLTAADWIALERLEYEESLYEFVKAAWPVVEPGTPLIEGWHLERLCHILEMVTRGEITRLCISIPPGYCKSKLVSVFWPAWEWARTPHLRIVTTSSSELFCDRDADYMRTIVLSDWYQRHWPMTFPSVNSISRFVNNSMGERTSKSYLSLTGVRSDRLLLDDVLPVDAANSETERDKVKRRFFDQSLSRGPGDKGAIVIIAQRIHEDDLIGAIMARQAEANLGFVFVNIPLQWEGDAYISDAECIPEEVRRDPRTKIGELILPAYQNERWVEITQNGMTSYAWSAQYQQNPIPKGRGFFREADMKLYQPAELPSNLVYYLASDHATGFNTKKNDYSVVRVWGVDEKGDMWLVDSLRERCSFNDALGVDFVDGQVRLKSRGALPFIAKYKPRVWYADADSIIKSSYQMIKQHQLHLGLYCQLHIVPQGGDKKDERAVPLQGHVEAGKVHFPNNHIGEAAVAEYLAFPVGKHDDQIDADGLLPRMRHHPASAVPGQRPRSGFDDYIVRGEFDGDDTPTSNSF